MHVQFSTFAVSIYDDMNTWTSSLKLLDSPAFLSEIHIRPCVPFGRTHAYALIPSNGLPSGMRALKGWLLLKVPFWVIIPCLHGGPKCTSVVPFEILHSEGPFEVAVLSTSVWNDPSIWLNDPNGNMTVIVFTPKCPSEGDISSLEHTEIHNNPPK